MAYLFRRYGASLMGFFGMIFLGGCQPSKKDHKATPLKPIPPFSSHLRELSVASLDGYAQCYDLQKDLENLGYAWANQVIDVNIRRINQGVATPTKGVAVNAAVNETATATSTESTAVHDNAGFQTNNQVAGVEEADLIQSNGTFVYVAINRTLFVHDLKGTLLQQETLKNPISGLLLVDHKLIVISSGLDKNSEQNQELGQLNSYRIQENGTLALITQKAFFGSYETARTIGNSLYTVTRQSLVSEELYAKLSLESFEDDPKNSSSKKSSFSSQKTFENYPRWAQDHTPQVVSQWAQARMEQLIGKDLSPQSCRHLVQLSLLQQVTSVGTPSVDLIQTLTRVSVINPETLAVLDDSGFFSSGTQPVIYANAEHLVVADSGWHEMAPEGVKGGSPQGVGYLRRDTFLTVLDLSSTQVLPQSLGIVEGMVLNQFSLDIHQNYLRIASTVEEQQVMNNGVAGTELWMPLTTASHSMVSIFPLTPGLLSTAGKVDNLGKGERIYAVRFITTKGFVVTYRQTDPFYTLDLSDPTAPKLMGELKVPGFSNYLHPIDDTHLLAVGSNGGSGLQVAVYNTADSANPQQQTQYVVPGWSSSQAQYDHHAFRYVPSLQLLVLPLTFYSIEGTNSNYFNGFQLFKIDLNSGIIPQGTVSHGTPVCEALPKRNLMDTDPLSSNRSMAFFTLPSFLPPRSLVFTASDQLITYQASLIQSTSFSTFLPQWSLSLPTKEAFCRQLFTP